MTLNANFMMKRSTTPITAYIDNMNKENITGK